VQVQATPKDELLEDIEPIVRGLGLRVVELRSRSRSGTLSVYLVVHKPGGVTLDECTTVYRGVYPRLELDRRGADIHLEVSSPGVRRVLKGVQEFGIFVGERASVYHRRTNDWVSGTICNADEHTVCLDTTDGTVDIDYDDVQKARLEYVEQKSGKE
jgi:ribosome maturation factor RimP